MNDVMFCRWVSLRFTTWLRPARIHNHSDGSSCQVTTWSCGAHAWRLCQYHLLRKVHPQSFHKVKEEVWGGAHIPNSVAYVTQRFNATFLQYSLSWADSSYWYLLFYFWYHHAVSCMYFIMFAHMTIWNLPVGCCLFISHRNIYYLEMLAGGTNTMVLPSWTSSFINLR